MKQQRHDKNKGNPFGVKRIVTYLLSCIVLVGLFSGLGGCRFTGRNKEAFRVGMECGYAPFNWTQMDAANGAVPIVGTTQYANGYDVQISKRVAKAMGRELEIVKISWAGLIPALQGGQIDAIAAGMSATEERKQSIDFSDNYYYSDLVVVVRANGPYAGATKLSDFSGAKLTGQLGTLHYSVIDQVPNVKKDKPLPDFPNMIVALKAGTVDGYISERPGAISAANANSNLKFISFPMGEGFVFDDAEVSIGVGLRIGDPIKAEINSALGQISEQDRETIMTDAIANQPSDVDATQSFMQAFGNIVKRYWLHFIKGAGVTLLLALVGTVVGLLIGIWVTVFRMIPMENKNKVSRGFHKTISFLLKVYIEVFRGTPMLVQATVFFYGFSFIFGVDLPRLLAGLIIVSVNTGAYMAEVVRGGIDSIDKGQFEAAKAIGMSHSQAMRSVVLPQAIRNILPATGNEFVINIKDTSVLNVIQVTELYFAAQDVQANTGRMFETYLVIAIIYLVLTFTVTRILHALEHKMDGPQNYMLTSSSMPGNVKVHQKQGRNEK